jgi:hypothetical protein
MHSRNTLSSLCLLLGLTQPSFARTPSDAPVEGHEPIPGSVEPGQVPETLPQFIYLRCNATGWDVNAATRMKHVPGHAQLYSLSYEVKEDWMVTAHDDCSFTATPVKDGWGDRQVYFGIRNGFLNVPNGSVNLSFSPQADVYFKIRYPAKGRYTAYLNLGDDPFFAVVPYVKNGH